MYTLVKKRNKIKSDSILELYGYSTKINKCNVVIYSQELIDILIKKKFIPEFNKLIKQVLVFLSEDDDPDNAAFLLDELSSLYNIYLNKYEKYLSSKEKRSIIKNFHVLTNELKKMARNKKIAPISKGRSR